MARTTFHTTEELDAWAAEHLRYEFTQLAANALLQVVDRLVLTPLRSASWVNNAVLESFLLHARSLDDFLGADHDNPRNPRANDVLAVDYLPAWEPQPALSPEDRRGVNRQLAHVSIQRVSGPERPWNFINISGAILATMGRFLSQFRDADPQERRSADTVAIEIGWQQALEMLNQYGLLAKGGEQGSA